MVPTKQPPLKKLKVEDLLFDPHNPRLPEYVLSPTTKEDKRTPIEQRIQAYFDEQGNLDELARSFADNGYFSTEPLIVTTENTPKGKWTVLEGNRRLAALRVLLYGSREEIERLGVELSASLKTDLGEVTTLEVPRRADATAMIGFRHIGGLKFWDSEAKARWIAHEVDAAKREPDPLGHIGRMVGMPTSQIRYYYVAATCARIARDEEKYDIRRLVANDRFGVFLRGIESPGVREHIGLGDATTYAEVQSAAKRVRAKPKPLVEVLDDLSKPLDATGKPLIEDSRQISKYGQMLTNPKVRKVLRVEGYQAALAALSPLLLDDQVLRVLRQLQKLQMQLTEETTLADDVVGRVKEIQRVAKMLRTDPGS